MTNILTHADLQQFTGSETWFRHPLVRQVLYTEGARHVAETGGAYWLLDEIAFAQKADAKLARQPFQTWTLTVAADNTASLRCADGNDRTLLEKSLSFTDFPLESITLWFVNNTILLPSEY